MQCLNHKSSLLCPSFVDLASADLGKIDLQLIDYTTFDTNDRCEDFSYDSTMVVILFYSLLKEMKVWYMFKDRSKPRLFFLRKVITCPTKNDRSHGNYSIQQIDLTMFYCVSKT